MYFPHNTKIIDGTEKTDCYIKATVSRRWLQLTEVLLQNENTIISVFLVTRVLVTDRNDDVYWEISIPTFRYKCTRPPIPTDLG